MKPAARDLKFVQAINEALDLCMGADPAVYVMGLGVPDPKGIFGTTLGLREKYGTARVLLSLSTALVRESFDSDHMRRRGVGWLVHVQNTDGGWGGGSGSPSSIEETGLALQACARGLAIDEQADILDAARRAVRWMIAATDEGRHTPAAPIGLYFARLWYFEELYPLVFGLAGLLETQSLSY